MIELHILVNADKKNNCQINLMILVYAKVIDVTCQEHQLLLYMLNLILQ